MTIRNAISLVNVIFEKIRLEAFVGNMYQICRATSKTPCFFLVIKTLLKINLDAKNHKPVPNYLKGFFLVHKHYKCLSFHLFFTGMESVSLVNKESPFLSFQLGFSRESVRVSMRLVLVSQKQLMLLNIEVLDGMNATFFLLTKECEDCQTIPLTRFGPNKSTTTSMTTTVVPG